MIGFNAAHGVVRGRTYRDRLFHRVDADIGLGQFTDERQTFQQFLFTQVAQVEINHVSARGSNGTAGTPFMPESLRNLVARAQFHVFVLWLTQRGFRPHAVVLQVAVAVFVYQNAAFATAAFGHQDTGARQAGRVILDELHITQRYAVVECHAHAITGDDTAVGVIAVHAAGTAGSHDYRIGTDLHAGAFHHVHRHQAAGLAVIYQNIQHKVLVETLDLRVFERGLEQGMQHVEAGLVGGEPGAFNLHAAEATYVD
ncbi:hypothetical protein D3C80_1266400 [compost metagenome]